MEVKFPFYSSKLQKLSSFQTGGKKRKRKNLESRVFYPVPEKNSQSKHNPHKQDLFLEIQIPPSRKKKSKKYHHLHLLNLICFSNNPTSASSHRLNSILFPPCPCPCPSSISPSSSPLLSPSKSSLPNPNGNTGGACDVAVGVLGGAGPARFSFSPAVANRPVNALGTVICGGRVLLLLLWLAARRRVDFIGLGFSIRLAVFVVLARRGKGRVVVVVRKSMGLWREEGCC